VEQLCKILQPFEQASVELSAEEKVTVSKVIVLKHNLQGACMKLKAGTASKVGQDLLDILIANLSRRFLNIERNMAFAVAAYLDPRFKRNAFRDETALTATKEEIVAVVRRMEQQAVTQTSSASASATATTAAAASTSSDNGHDLLWGDFDSSLASIQPNPTSTAIVELRRYNEEDIVPRQSCPMEWWKSRALVYPHLVKLAVKHACMMATSVPCERVFSQSGQLLNERRSRLKAKNVQMVMFLHQNSKLL